MKIYQEIIDQTENMDTTEKKKQSMSAREREKFEKKLTQKALSNNYYISLKQLL